MFFMNIPPFFILSFSLSFSNYLALLVAADFALVEEADMDDAHFEDFTAR